MPTTAREAGIRLAPDTHSAVTEWRSHLEAGRLTAAAPATPAPQIAANRARTEAILRAHAAAHRAALQAC